jgi:uncharacterized protein (TIGR02271 family)
MFMNENYTDPKRDKNADPITGEPGAHPVGTGVGTAVGGAGGAAAGAAAGAAIGTAGAGPIGAGVGVVAGAIIGAALGHGAAEGLNPTNSPEEGKYIDYTVIGRDDHKIGTVDSVWLDSDGDPAYLALRTGWLGMGKTHVVPAQSANVSDRKREIRLPYTAEQIKNAPDFDSSVQLQPADENRIGSYYETYGFRRDNWLASRRERETAAGRKSAAASMPAATGSTTARKPAETSEKRLQLKEEELKVGKREVEYGGVRLRKVVRTEVVNRPVELKREEIVVERIPAGQATSATGEFTEDEIYVPLRREEAVVQKEAHVREEVRVGKRSETEKKTVSEKVRKEDVEIQRETPGEAPTSRLNATGDRAKTPRYEPKERSRS